MFTYTYVGDVPTVFVALRKDDKTWTPSKGDQITTAMPVIHPLLVEVVKEVTPTKEDVVPALVKVADEPEVTKESSESSVATDKDER